MGSALFEAKKSRFFPLGLHHPSELGTILLDPNPPLTAIYLFFFFPLFFLLTRGLPLGFFSKQSHQAVTLGAP